MYSASSDSTGDHSTYAVRSHKEAARSASKRQRAAGKRRPPLPTGRTRRWCPTAASDGGPGLTAARACLCPRSRPPSHTAAASVGLGRPPPGRRRRRRRPTPGAAADGRDVGRIRPLRALADAARVAENFSAASARGSRTVRRRPMPRHARRPRRRRRLGRRAWPAGGGGRLGAAGGACLRRFGSVVRGFGFGVSGFPRCRHKERVTVLFYCTVRLEFVHVCDVRMDVLV